MLSLQRQFASKEALDPSFKDYIKSVKDNAVALSDGLKDEGFKVVSNGTDNHLVLMDLSGSEVSGKMLEEALGKIDITVNKNTVPNETRSPFVTSGIRLGTAALSTRKMGTAEMKKIASWIKAAYENIDNDAKLEDVKSEVVALAKEFPLYKMWS